MGAPYCGLVAVCGAAGCPVDKNELMDWASSEHNGTIRWVADFARVKGVNLSVTAQGHAPFVFEFSPAYKWVRLHLRDEHYFTICSKLSSIAPVDFEITLSRYLEDRGDTWYDIPAWIGYTTSAKASACLSYTDNDARQISERRDKPEYQDKLLNVVFNNRWRFTPWGILFLFALLSFSHGLTVVVFLFLTWYCPLGETDNYVVSVTRLGESITKMHAIADTGGDTKLAIAKIYSDYRINTPVVHDGHNVLADTAAVALFVSRVIKRGKYERGPSVAHNTPNDQMYADKLEIIARNQEAGIRGFDSTCNYVMKKRKYVTTEVKNNVQVAVAPVGPPLCCEGPAGPGLISVTDSVGIISAFAVRSMSKEKKPSGYKWELIFKSVDYFKSFVDSTPDPGPEPTVHEAYKSVNKGKKSLAAIDVDLEKYDSYNEGTLNKNESVKIARHGCFNKFESNVKRDAEKSCYMKARLIMTMSLIMAIELSPVVTLVHAFNKSAFQEHQVKDCTPQQMSEKVESITGTPHTVTDYSSYESSIDIDYRLIELMLLLALCVKFKFINTYKSIMKHCFSGRVLTAAGLKLWITTRCSGDYITSFGNGVLSYAIMKFCSEKNGIRDFRGIFEGDDGIVASNVPNLSVISDLGFKFSLAYNGVKPGDCDFLSSRFMDGKRFLNVAKYIVTFMWVRTPALLKMSKVLYIWRCMGASLYYLSPGHPILTALVNFIGKFTAGVNSFKGYEKFIDKYKFVGYDSAYPRDVVVDESMRQVVADGSAQFVPISIETQLLLEESISNGVFHYGDTFSNDEGFCDYVDSFRIEHTNHNYVSILDALKEA